VSSLHEVAAYSAIDSDVGPRTGSGLAIDSRAVVRRASDTCTGYAWAIRVCEERIMWRSRSRKGWILSTDWLEAT
jgi:hypothetical protein